MRGEKERMKPEYPGRKTPTASHEKKGFQIDNVLVPRRDLNAQHFTAVMTSDCGRHTVRSLATALYLQRKVTCL